MLPESIEQTPAAARVLPLLINTELAAGSAATSAQVKSSGPGRAGFLLMQAQVLFGCQGLQGQVQEF